MPPNRFDSSDYFDVSAVSGRFGERTVAGNDRRVNRLCKGDVHGVVSADVVSQLPRTPHQIHMGVAVEIQVSEIRNHLVGAAGKDFTHSYETPEPLNHFDVHKVWCMELVLVTKEARLDSCAESSLQQKLQKRRCIDNDHADSRSSRMTTAAGVFRVTRFRLWSLASISSRVGRAATRSSSARR